MMHGLWNHSLLLAQRSRLDHLSDSFKGQPNSIDKGEMMTGLLILAGVAALVWLLSRFLAYQDRRQAYNSPLRLFLALVQGPAAPLAGPLAALAAGPPRRLKDSGRLFLEPQWFERSGLPRSLLVQFGAVDAASRSALRGTAVRRKGRIARRSRRRGRRGLQSPGPTVQTVTPLLSPPPNPALDIPPWPVAPLYG